MAKSELCELFSFTHKHEGVLADFCARRTVSQIIFFVLKFIVEIEICIWIAFYSEKNLKEAYT